MPDLDLDRIRDLELMRTVAKVQDAELRRLHDVMRVRERFWAQREGKSAEEIERLLLGLEEDIAERLHRVYGGGSERRPRKNKPDNPPKAPQKGHGPRPQPELLVEEKVHVLDEADEVCPSCGEDLPPWEGQFEDSEEIDVVEMQYVLKKHRRQKYRCSCGHIETALGPEKSVLGGGRSNEQGEAMLQDYTGVAVTDGYVVYDSLSKKNGFVLANCWSHARRKFIEAEASAPEDAGDILDKTGAIFAIETEADVMGSVLSREEALDLCARFREKHTKPIVNDMGRWRPPSRHSKGAPWRRRFNTWRTDGTT